jgi:hypothetical protein
MEDAVDVSTKETLFDSMEDYTPSSPEDLRIVGNGDLDSSSNTK